MFIVLGLELDLYKILFRNFGLGLDWNKDKGSV